MFYNIKGIIFASVFMVLVFKVMKTFLVVMTLKRFSFCLRFMLMVLEG